ncbi:MAG TPA: GAF domain-containing protein, partial [Chloroflexota bacterium]
MHRSRFAFLARASEVLASSLQSAELPKKLASLAVPDLADLCVVRLLAGNTIADLVTLASVDPLTAAAVEACQSIRPGCAPDGHPVILAAQRAAVLIPEVTDASLAELAGDDQQLAALRDLGLRSVIVVPLVAGKSMLGAMHLAIVKSRRRFSAEDFELSSQLARLAALAFDRARTHEQLRRLRL